MNSMKRPFALILLNLVFIAVFGGFSHPIHAEGEFTTKYDLTYEVDPVGITTVIYQVEITNLTTQYYVSEYDLTIPSAKIEEIIAADRGGQIVPEVTKDEDSTKIHLVFNTKAIGKGSTLPFTLSYQTPEFAQKNGRIWEINLPPRSKNPELTEYNVKLKVPQSFGPPAYVFPKPTLENELSWTKEQMEGGATLAFGDYQIFRFNLKYHLENTKLFPFYTEIALPADNSYQRIKIDRINPKPISIRQDEDGNWLARYDLSPGEKIDIEAQGLVKISPFPDLSFPQKEAKSAKYLMGQNFWEVTDSQIQKLARELKTPQAIYDYVVSTLKYDYQKAKGGGKRLGAKGALAEPEKAICMEFTDLFIALSRAAGIPAREVDGFAYTTDSKLRPLSAERDILHAWPEYWDSQRKTWVMVDPTWGATTGGIDYFQKLDFNHFALAVRGISSEFPLPAGGYKLEGNETKDVEVEFTPVDWQDKPNQYEVNWNLPAWVITGLGFDGSVRLKNIGSSAIYGKPLILDSNPSGLLQNGPETVSLAPGESQKISLRFSQQNWFKGFDGVVFLVIDGMNFSKPFIVQPLGWIIIFVLAALGISAGVIIMFICKRRCQNDQITNRPSAENPGRLSV